VAHRIAGWLLLTTGCVVFALGAFMAWATWDMTSWGFASIAPTAALAAGLGAIALATALTLLRGRPMVSVVAVALLGMAAFTLAIDLFARNAGWSLFGDALDWQGSDADGISSLWPAWGLLAQGAALIVVAVWVSRRPRPGRVGRAAPCMPSEARPPG
jgi:hypothetical protein